MNSRVLILVGLVIVAVVIIAGVFLLLPMLSGGNDGGTTSGGSGEVVQIDENDRAEPTPTEFPVTYVVLSLQNLPRGYRIQAQDVTVELWPAESGVQENAFSLPAEALEDGYVSEEEKNEYLTSENSPVGQVVRTQILRWQPVLQSMVVPDLAADPTIAEDVGSQTSAILPEGKVAISLPMDMLGGVAYAIADGDRVDVVLSFLFVDVDETFQSIEPNIQSLVTVGPEGGITVEAGQVGRFEASSILGVPVIIVPTEDQRPRLVTQRTVQNALVLHVGTYPHDGNFLGKGATAPTAVPQEPVEEGDGENTPQPTPIPPRPSVITIGVDPQEAVALIWAMEAQVPITLMLRSARDFNAAPDPTTQAVSLEYLVTTYQIERPPRLDYALEPRITEVRSVNGMLRNAEAPSIWYKDITTGRSRGGTAPAGQ
jgi:Flp pilus assembly protein CpaB